MEKLERTDISKILLGVLTYDTKHRKTYDTLCLLKAKGYENVVVYVQPMHYQKKFKPLLQHRPGVVMDIPDIDTLCRNFSYSVQRGEIAALDIPKDTIFLVCGAGIIPECVRKKHTIINAHPGYIPVVRGLDAFKWAVWEGSPIGVSTHFIGEYVDAGVIIDRRIIEINENTTFFEAAQCVYENEVTMLVEAVEKLNEPHVYAEPENYEVHRRMPNEVEKQLLSRFEEYKLQTLKGNING